MNRLVRTIAVVATLAVIALGGTAAAALAAGGSGIDLSKVPACTAGRVCPDFG